MTDQERFEFRGEFSEYGSGSTQLLNMDPILDPVPQHWYLILCFFVICCYFIIIFITCVVCRCPTLLLLCGHLVGGLHIRGATRPTHSLSGEFNVYLDFIFTSFFVHATTVCILNE